VKPYYVDDQVTLYHADALSMPGWPWTDCDVMVTDPPYGRAWRQGANRTALARRIGDHRQSPAHGHSGIAGDAGTYARDRALALWGWRHAILFGHLTSAPPQGTVQVLVYRKPTDAGTKGTFAGFRRDVEGVYLVGPWPAGLNGDTSVLQSGARNMGNPAGLAARYRHPHAKPVDVMCDLISRCPHGAIADPFAGSGSTLIAARMDGRKAVGVEIDERHCETAALRLSQQILDLA
jgi:site-specific DNA-methyltransferase (adenine-specific)